MGFCRDKPFFCGWRYAYSQPQLSEKSDLRLTRVRKGCCLPIRCCDPVYIGKQADLDPFSAAGGTLTVNLSYLKKAILGLPAYGKGVVYQSDAATQSISANKLISTDPPYFDNVPYADLSDFFYEIGRASCRER